MKVSEKGYNYMIFIICLFISLIFANSSVKAEGNSSEKIFYLNDDKNITGTLFTKDELIGPGDKLYKEFYIVNNNNFKCYLNSIVLDGNLYDQSRKILDKNSELHKNYMKYASISFYCEDKLIYSGHLDELVNIDLVGDDSIEMTDNGRKKFSVEYSLDKDADNRTMNMEHKFDITFNFSAIESQPGGGTEPTIVDKVVTGPKLVQTGYFLDIKVLIILGSLLCVTGLIFFSNKKYL